MTARDYEKLQKLEHNRQILFVVLVCIASFAVGATAGFLFGVKSSETAPAKIEKP